MDRVGAQNGLLGSVVTASHIPVPALLSRIAAIGSRGRRAGPW